MMPFANCDGVASNGCEINTSNNPSNCGRCGQACGAPTNTTGVTCSAGMCSFMCAANTYNQNGAYPDGCECAGDTTTSHACGATTALTAPGSAAGRILPVGQSNWYAFTFPSFNGSCGKHYTITLQNAGNPIEMNVFQNCSGSAMTCNTAGDVTTNYAKWEWNNNPSSGTSPQCTETIPTTVYVQVSAIGSSPTCMDYSLSVFSQ
jgi:hypothetical protein